MEISAENLPDRKIRVVLTSESYAGKVVIIPSDYPMGWVFSGKAVEMEPGKEAVVELEYEPSVWTDEHVTLQALSADGRQSSGKIAFALEEEKYFWEEHGYYLFVLVSVVMSISLALNFYLIFRKK